MKRNQLYFDIVSTPLKEYLYKRFKNITHAAARLEVNLSVLSKVIRGEREAGSELIVKLTRDGFSKSCFDKYYASKALSPEHLTNEEVIKLYTTQKIALEERDRWIVELLDRLSQRDRAIQNMTKTFSEWMKKFDMKYQQERDDIEAYKQLLIKQEQRENELKLKES
ncbi:MAG: hypothetical protein M1391_14655 [Bacteroidetes bacterium]|nr:hypothetical protein [Bacteroidota bacterium]